MQQDELDQTMRQIQRLAWGFGRRPTADTIQHAQDVIAQIFEALVAENEAIWQRPTVEAGKDAVVVFLWQAGPRYLSLIVRADGPLHWVFHPGFAGGDANNLDVSSRLARGTCTPETFVLDLWPTWSSGDDLGRTRLDR